MKKLNFTLSLTILLSGLMLTGCSLWHKTSEKVVTDKDLCTSKQQIVINGGYYSAWKACERLTAKGDYEAEYVLGMLYADDKILGSFLNSETRVQEGIAHIKNAADHNIPEAARTLGEFYDQQGNTSEALKYLEIAANAKDTDAIISLAATYESMGQCQKAKKLYQEEIALKKDNAEGWLYLFLISTEGCSDLKPNMNEACGYYHKVVTTQAASTLQSLLHFEENNGTSKEKASITSTAEKIHNYYLKNQNSCEQKAIDIEGKLITK